MKNSNCKCIPELVLAPESLTVYSYKKYENDLYTIIDEDFVKHDVYFKNKKVLLDFYKTQDGKSDTFFHVLCGDKKEYPNFRRAERINFPRRIIENYEECNDCQESCKIKLFVKKIHNKKRYHLFSEEYLYMVVLEEQGKYMKLVTSFYIDQKYMLYNYNIDYENYIQQLEQK